MIPQENFIKSASFEFKRYKTLGEKTFEQLNQEDFFWHYGESDNCIATIVKHLSGNMQSRWTNFLKEDGEKEWRNREAEFQNTYTSQEEIYLNWNKGWNTLFNALQSITSKNFDAKIKIRDEEHTLIEAIHRQLAHYSLHVGQIIVLGKMIKGNQWKSISIPKGNSEVYNPNKFNS